MTEHELEAVDDVELEADDDTEAPMDESSRHRSLISEPKDYSIGELYMRYKDGRLNVQPEFQRHYVFDNAKASRLVESVLMGVPIPVIYLAEEEDYTHSVIDGQQRITALCRFHDNELRLTGLTVLTELSGQTYQNLARDLQNRFREGSLRAIIIKRDSDPDIRFEIFERLNTGSVNLNSQELRNCIYRGRYNQLLRELAEDKEFQQLFGRKGPDKRMQDREAILRFFALCHNLTTYNPPMKRFLNREMERLQDITDQTVDEMTQQFRKCVQCTLTVFGEHAFKRFYPGTSDDPSGRWEPKRINMALYDVIMVGFTSYERHQVTQRADAIRDALIDLLVSDRHFVNMITLGTSERERMHSRMNIWRSKLDEVIGAPEMHPRLFPPELKRQMFEQNPICGICGQTIQIIDDAHVDHIEQYHHGGKTAPNNARLTHRYCNVARARAKG